MTVLIYVKANKKLLLWQTSWRK